MPRSTNSTHTPALLTAALQGLELQKARIEEHISAVRGMLGGQSMQQKRAKPVSNGSPKTAAAPAEQKRTRMPLSAAARKRIAAAQKRRWAEYRKAQG
jgi:hypothetical protein